MLKENPQPNHADFRDIFHSSDRFEALMQNTREFKKSHPGLYPLEFQKSFTGRVFEEIGYLWFRTRLKPHQRLLDPDQTQEHFLELYGGLPAHTLLQGGILNEYLPDGLILSDDEGQGNAVIVEYTAQDRNARLPKYIHHKEDMVKSLRKRFPDSFGKGKLQIIFTHDVHKTVKRTRGVDQRTTLTSTPFHHDDIHAYAQELVRVHFDLPE